MSAPALLGWLAWSSLVASLMVLAVVRLRGPVRRTLGANAALALWLAPGLRLVLPPLGLGVLPRLGAEEGPAPLPAPDPITPDPDAAALLTGAPDLPGAPDLLGAPDAPSTVATPAAAPSAPEALGGAAPDAFEGAAPQAFAEALPGLPLLVLAVWALGVVVTLGWTGLRTASWRRTILAEGTAPGPALAARLREQAAGLGVAPPALILSGAAASPQLLGPRRPLIALPDDFAERFTPGQQRLALAHELTHLKRRDLTIAALAEALCAIHWFNPFLRRALFVLRADQEAACDEAVRAAGASTPDYARALLRAASGPSVPALTLNHALKERIEAMRHPLPARAVRLLGGVGVLALAVGAATAVQSGRAAPDDAPDAASQRGTNTVIGTRDDGTAYAYRWDDGDLVLLGDPFARIEARMPKEPPAPAEPMPPVPPVTPGAGFEEGMEAFGDRMEAWGDAYGETMGAWGDEMGEWGEAMGEVGEAVGDLAERCEDHRERTDAPTILSMRVATSGETVRAVCASGGPARYASAELTRFVGASGALTREEKAAFRREARPAGRLAALRAAQEGERGEGARDGGTRAGGDQPLADAVTAPFDEVEASSGTDVTIRRGDAHSVRLDDRARERTEVEVEDGVLRVRCKPRGMMRGCARGDRGEVTVTMPTLTGLGASSGAALTVADAFDVEELRVAASSGASVEVEAAMTAGTLRAEASSGASVDAARLSARVVAADASSGASVEVTATERLDAEASSGASIRHRGGAQEVTVQKSSGGSITGR